MRPLSFNAFNASPYLGAGVPLREQIAAAADAGFALIGIDRFTLDAFEAEGGRLDRAAGWLSATGLGCGAITAAGMLGVESDPAGGLSRAGVRARALGAPFVQVNMGAATGQVDMLDAACSAVGDEVRLALEYMPFTPLARVADAVALVRRVGVERAGVLIDIWHHERGPDSWDDLAAVDPAAIAYVEFDDAGPANDDPADTVDARLLPGEGLFDCSRFAATIAAIGYDGPVSVEILNRERRGQPLRDLARDAYRTSRRYW